MNKKNYEIKLDLIESNLFNFDMKIRSEDHTDLIMGFDEAGRGPICGPVVCAGVCLDKNFVDSRINDSKKLTEKEREILYKLIIDNALAYKIEVISAKTIDKINILEASRLGMQKAYEFLKAQFNTNYSVLTDYMKLKVDDNTKLHSLAKGDATSIAIACASILAKVTRDNIMDELALKYPNYDLNKNKGYPTKKHIEAVNKFGATEEHRMTFKPLKKPDQEKYYQEKLF